MWADVQPPAALTGTDPSCLGDSPCKLCLGHLRSTGSVWRRHRPRLPYTAWPSPARSGMGDYEAACAGTGPGVLGWKRTAQHSSVAGSGLVAPRCTAPLWLCHSSHGTTAWMGPCVLAVPPQCCCRGRTSLPATPAPAKGGWRKGGPVCTSLGWSGVARGGC